MSERPDALRLADELEDEHYPWPRFPAAYELRRLYQLAMDQQGEIYALKMARSMEQKTAALKRDALLEALRKIEPILARMYGPQAAELPPMQIVRAAIKAVEEGK